VRWGSCSALVIAAALLSGAAAAAPLAQREVLPNGMVLLVSERRALPIVAVNVYVRAGSVLDPPGAGGLANLTASLLTRGTARHRGAEIDRAIEFVGGSLGSGGGRDGAAVSLGVLAKDLPLGLDLLAEVLTRPAFPEDEVKRKVGEIQAALQNAETDPETVAGRAIAPLLYPGHPYTNPAAGTVQSVGGLDRDQIVRFHRAHYRPDATTIAVVGDVSAADVRAGLLARLGGWRAPAVPLPSIPIAPSTVPAAARTITRELTQTTVYLGRPAIRQLDPDYPALVVASYILGGGSTSRLYVRVREDRGLAYSVGSSLGAARHGASLLVSLQTRNESADEAVRLVREEMRRLGEADASAAELDLAKAYLIGSYALRTDTSSKLALLIASLEELGLSLDYPERYRERIGAVTAADVRRVATRFLDPDSFSTVIVGGGRTSPYQ
jgi:zinc protease